MNLKKYQKESGKTIKETAQELNIPFSTYNNYLIGYREPNIETIIKLASYFNISSDELLGITKKQAVNLTEKNALLKIIDSLTEIECHKLKIFAEGLISNRIEKTSAFKVLKDDRE